MGIKIGPVVWLLILSYIQSVSQSAKDIPVYMVRCY